MKKKVVALFFVIFILFSVNFVSARMCDTQQVLDVLRKALYIYYTNPDESSFAAEELKALLEFYVSIQSGQITVDCTAQSENIDKADILLDTIPSCSDGTKYGKCSTTKPMYCYAGRLVPRCRLCGCPTGQSCDVTYVYTEKGNKGQWGKCYPGKNITCTVNTDCGTSGYIGNYSCTNLDVYRNYTKYTCLNPGETNSSCKTDSLIILIDDCNTTEQCIEGQAECQITNATQCVTPTSGMSITKDTTFCAGTYDLSSKITIDSNSIILDCNNAILRNNGLSSSYHSSVTIKNCAIENAGIEVGRGSYIISDNFIKSGQSYFGINLGYADSSKVFNNIIQDGGKYGLLLIHTSSSEISGNTIKDNGAQWSPGGCNYMGGIALLYDSANNSIHDNTLTNNNPANIWIRGHEYPDYPNNNKIWKNTLYNTGVWNTIDVGCNHADSYKSYNTYCVDGIGNNYYDGATGPGCGQGCTTHDVTIGNGQCVSFTPHTPNNGQPVILKPLYCDNGRFVDNCQKCGCYIGTCQGSGNCEANNLALNKYTTCFASSATTNPETAKGAVDGNKINWDDNHRFATRTGNNVGYYWQVDLGQIYIVNKTIIYSNPDAPRDFPKGWRLLKSNDGTNWETIITETNSLETCPLTYDFTPTQARYLKIIADANNYDSFPDGWWWYMQEFEVYGSQLQTCTDGTVYGECSTTNPKYCSNGVLIDNPGVCGCEVGYVYDSLTNSCLRWNINSFKVDPPSLCCMQVSCIYRFELNGQWENTPVVQCFMSDDSGSPYVKDDRIGFLYPNEFPYPLGQDYIHLQNRIGFNYYYKYTTCSIGLRSDLMLYNSTSVERTSWYVC